MRWFLLILGIIAAVLIVVTAVGAALPRDHVATRALHVPVTPDRVWTTITDVAAFPSWRPDVTAIEMLPPRNGLPAWREIAGRDSVAYAIVAMVPPARLTTTITDLTLPYGGQWEYAITPTSDGATVVITEYGTVRNPIFRFVSRFVMGHTATLDTYLTALATHVGATTRPIDAPPVARAR